MRIWVSRPEPGASRTARRLAELGHAALVAPVLRIAPSDGPLPTGRFDGLILTSANAAAPLAAAGLPEAPVFAVGTRTAERAERAGLRSVHCADGDAVSLARLVAAHVRPGGALLHAAGEDRKAEPAASLTAAGYGVTTWTAYAALAEATLPEPVVQGLIGRDGAQPLAAALHFRDGAPKSRCICPAKPVWAERFGRWRITACLRTWPWDWSSSASRPIL